MKKLALTIAIVLGLGMTTFAQAEYYGQEGANQKSFFGYGVSFFDNRGNLALFADFSQFDRAVEEDYYDYEYDYEPTYYGQNGLFGLGSTGLFFRPGRGLGGLPSLPGFGQEGDGDAPLGSGIAVLLGLGGAYLVAKKRKED